MAGPSSWNALPVGMRSSSFGLDTIAKHLKTHPFGLAYSRQGTHFWVRITFCRVRHGDSVTKQDYYYYYIIIKNLCIQSSRCAHLTNNIYVLFKWHLMLDEGHGITLFPQSSHIWHRLDHMPQRAITDAVYQNPQKRGAVNCRVHRFSVNMSR